MASSVSFGARALQILFAIVVLGISVTFMKAQHVGSSPVTTRYSVFVGAFGIIVGALGLISHWVQAIPSIVPVAADGFSALFFLAGGISWAVGMKGASCAESSLKSLYDNPLLNQGCEAKDNNNSDQGPYCYVAGKQTEDPWPLSNLWPNPMKNVCDKAYTNESFQFLGFVVCIILVVFGFIAWRKQGGKPRFIA